MERWEQLQLFPDYWKSEEGQGNYQDKTQKLLKTMKAWVIKWLSVGLPQKKRVREFDFWNVFSKDLCGVRFFKCSSYQESTVFMNLQNFLLKYK